MVAEREAKTVPNIQKDDVLEVITRRGRKLLLEVWDTPTEPIKTRAHTYIGYRVSRLSLKNVGGKKEYVSWGRWVRYEYMDETGEFIGYRSWKNLGRLR